MNTSDLIQPRHLARRAVIYVRQSSPHQVMNNQESQRLQYALKQRVIELGWHEHDLEVIDSDLGITGTLADPRKGFQHLVAEVALGEVGILIAYEAQRLARNCTHWYQLLDLCGHADCLIADRDGVYDASSVNGRLLLGLKGQISELELHIMRGRLLEGRLNKAKRGELSVPLPTGLVRLPSGEVGKHPDREVQNSIGMVFKTLEQKKSIAQVVAFFLKEDLKIPRQDRSGDIHWTRVTRSGISLIVKNPAYAGAFTYGRTRSVRDEKTGKYRSKPLPANEWKICIPDKYPAYISWESFEKISRMLQDNYGEYVRRKSRGVPREGDALLQGIVYCGECGHKMCVNYHKKDGPLYLCAFFRMQRTERLCQRLSARPIDAQVVRWFFEALSVAEINLAADALQEADGRRDEVLAANRQQIERLRYQARLAERQYQHSDPENRLVTGELERRWEMALRELKEAEEQLIKKEQTMPHWTIPADLLDALKEFGPRLPELWEQRLFNYSQKKSLLRCLIEKVVLQRVAKDKVRVRVVWRGGATTSDDVILSVQSFAELPNAKEMEEAILRMAQAGQSDEQIAAHLITQGFHSARTNTVPTSTIKAIRRQHRVLQQPSHSHPFRVAGHLTIPQLAAALRVQPHWFHDRIRNGTIRIEKDASKNCYLFPDKEETLRKFRELLEGKITQLEF